MNEKTPPLTAAERLHEASLLAQQARSRLWYELSSPGLIVAVIIKTFDGTVVEVMINQAALNGGDIGTGPLVKVLHDAVESYSAKLPGVVKIPTEMPS